MNWKKYLLAFSSIAVLVASEQLIHACSDYDSYDTYPSFFGNKASDKPAYTPFFYVGDDLYYDDYMESGPGADAINKQLMLKEWQEYSKSAGSLKDIEALLYDTDISSIEALDKKVPETLSGNTFAEWLSQSRQKEVLRYVRYAKACEINATVRNDEWDTTRSKPVMSNIQLMEEGMELRKKTKDDFLKMKYTFQVLRMAFYEGEYDKVLSLYEALLGDKTADRSIAYTRCLGFKAGAWYKKKDKARAGYYYSRMFVNSDAYKTDAMISYEWCRTTYDPDKGEKTNDYTEAIYNLCQNDKERAGVMVMNAMRDVGMALPLIEKAYALDPSVPGIDVLVNREINKVEEHYFSNIVYDQNKLPNTSSYWYYDIRNYDYTSGDPGSKESINRSYTDYLHQLNRLTDKMIAEGKNASPAFWQLSSAYISYMQQDKPKMNKALAAAKAVGMNATEQRLYNVIDILALLKNTTTLNPAAEAELLPKLKNLDALAIKDYGAGKTFRDIMQHLIAGKYLQQQDTSKAVYAMAHASSSDSDRHTFYASEGFKDIQGNVLDAMSIPQLRKVQEFAAGKQNTAYEQWLVSGTYYTPTVLKELEATKYIREYKFKEAAQLFAKISPEQKFPSPFMPQINDIIEADEAEVQKGYTKLGFSKRMAELQDIIAKNPNDAGALYGYAVALYNISYYGKASNIVDYTRDYTSEIAYYASEEWKKMSRPFQEYYGVYTAEQYFNKAAAAATDPELKAKSLWGAAKCWGKRCPVLPESRYGYDNVYFLNAIKNPYFTKLFSGYNQTKYMQAAQSTCDYYSAYLRRNR